MYRDDFSVHIDLPGGLELSLQHKRMTKSAQSSVMCYSREVVK